MDKKNISYIKKYKRNILLIIFFRIQENWISLSKSFQPEDKSPGVETLTLTAPFSIAIVYKLQFLLHYCCTIILHPRGKRNKCTAYISILLLYLRKLEKSKHSSSRNSGLRGFQPLFQRVLDSQHYFIK